MKWRHLFAKQDPNYTLTMVNPSKNYAPKGLITIIINNLIKNAFNYSIHANISFMEEPKTQKDSLCIIFIHYALC
jgi:hypothetical protein